MISSYYLAQYLALALGVLTGPVLKMWLRSQKGNRNGL